MRLRSVALLALLSACLLALACKSPPLTAPQGTVAPRRWDPLTDGQAARRLGIWPLDESNAQLLDEVRPREWPDPVPPDCYDLVVIGAGAGGLVSSKQAARRGARSCLISQELAGGDCLNIGCVPSKALLRAARAVRAVRGAAEFGVVLDAPPRVDFGRVMSELRRRRAQIAPADSHAATVAAGADVYQGRGRFTGPHTIEVNGQQLRFRKAVIATGGRARVPSIPGLSEVPYLTNADVFNLEELPRRLTILGAGAVGLEMAQAFATFGASVTVVGRSSVLLKEEPKQASEALRQALEKDGVRFVLGAEAVAVERAARKEVRREEGGGLREGMGGEDGGGGGGGAEGRGEAIALTLRLTDGGGMSGMGSAGGTSSAGGAEAVGTDGMLRLVSDALLIASGRVPNTADLGLELAGVEHSAAGVIVDDLLRTSNPDVYGVGDCVAGTPRLTHMAGEMAKIAVQNALFRGSWRLSSLVVPRCIYTEPELASTARMALPLPSPSPSPSSSLSLSPTPTPSPSGDPVAEAEEVCGEEEQGAEEVCGEEEQEETHFVALRGNDRAILEGEAEDGGFVLVRSRKATGQVVGGTVLASRAGEIINEISLAVKAGLTMEALGRNVHPYPSTGEAVMGCGLQWINARWTTMPEQPQE